MQEFWQTAVLGPLSALGGQIIGFLPNVLAMFLILSVGLAAAIGSSSLTERLLRIIGLDRFSNRLGVTTALARGGVKAEPSHLVGRAVYWLVIVFATIAALGTLNLQPLNQFVQSSLAYLPHLLTAALILASGYLLSNFVAQAVLITAVNAGLPPARLVAVLARWAVQLLAAAMALEQLGIARNIVVVGFGITLGGVVLAAAIAFGLGGKELAKEFLERRLLDRSGDRAPDDLRHL